MEELFRGRPSNEMHTCVLSRNTEGPSCSQHPEPSLPSGPTQPAIQWQDQPSPTLAVSLYHMIVIARGCPVWTIFVCGYQENRHLICRAFGRQTTTRQSHVSFSLSMLFYHLEWPGLFPERLAQEVTTERLMCFS